MKFDADYTLSEAFLSQYFYKGLRLSIKLWMNDKSRKLLACNNLVKKLLRAVAKAKI